MKRSGGGGCPFMADEGDVTVDVSTLGPELEALIYEKLGLEAPESALLSKGSFLGMFLPTHFSGAPFFGGWIGGAAGVGGGARLADELLDVNPLWIEGGATALALIGHLLARTPLTLGLLAGAGSTLLVEGAVALVDLILGSEETMPVLPGGAGAGTETAIAMHGAGTPQLGALTRQGLEQIQKTMQILQPGGGEQRSPGVYGATEPALDAVTPRTIRQQGEGLAHSTGMGMPPMSAMAAA